jgi:alpha-tubulin suppressor-like RCC1 family protein
MARWLMHAAAMTTVVVCSSSWLAGSPRSDLRLKATNVGSGSVAAGRAHTAIATPGGRVFTWGAGGRGQIGDGARMDRATPMLVHGLERVIAVSAGAAHTVALTTTGEVYAWGANAYGRLGDGTRKRRLRPVRVTGLSGVTMIAAGRAHTLALTADGRVFAWGLNAAGQLGTGKRVNAMTPVLVSGLSNVTSIAAGDGHSLAVTRDGRVWAWGNNAASRLGDGTTKDRLRPVALTLTDVVSVAAGATHSLALRRTGEVYAWGQGTHGELGIGTARNASTPRRIEGLSAVALSAGRHFSAAIRGDGTVVAWGLNASGQLGDGTTTRRLQPVVVQGLSSATALALGDAHAIAVTASGQLRTWGEGMSGRLGSAAQTDASTPLEIESEIVDWDAGEDDEEEPPGPVDAVPPTVVISVAPQPFNGWNNTPVDISFVCADDVAVASCPDAVTIAEDGANQRVTRQVIDTSGNQISADVILNIDRTGPAIVLASDLPGDVDVSTLRIDATVADQVSGVASASCNGVPAALAAGAVRCTIPLIMGRNVISVSARDHAGNPASVSVLVNYFPSEAASSAILTPPAAGLIVGESRTFVMTDNHGRRIAAPQWQTSDEAVVTFSDGVATAVGVGSAVLTASADGLTASTEVEVYAGPYLPAGAARWALPVAFGDGLTTETILADGVDGAHVYSVEYADERRALATVRAIGVDGSVQWVGSLPLASTEVVRGIAAAPNGGLLAHVTTDFGQGATSLVRAGWSPGTPSWRYEVPSGVTIDHALQAPNGFIYALQGSRSMNDDWLYVGARSVERSEIVGIDGATGAVVFRQLQPTFTGFCRCVSGSGYVDELQSSAVSQLTLTSDGDVYYLLRTGWESYVEAPLFSTRYDLVRLSASGAKSIENLYQGAGDSFRDPSEGPDGLMVADGQGGVLVQWARNPGMYQEMTYSGRYRSTAESREFLMTAPVQVHATSLDGTLIGRQQGVDEKTIAMDMRSGDIKWSLDDRRLTATVALADGGAIVADWFGNYTAVDGHGNVGAPAAHGVMAGLYAYGRFHGRDDDHRLKAVPSGPLDDATAFSGLHQGTQISSAPAKNYGLHAKAYDVGVEGHDLFKHLGLALVPRNQAAWRSPSNQWNAYFKQSPGLYGDLWIVTTGGDQDGPLLAPRLVQVFNNQAGDFWKPADPGYWFPVSPQLEDATIRGLLAKSLAFRDHLLPYELTPLQLSPGYNSNSFMRALLELQGIVPPPFFTTFRFPGSSKPVPTIYFDPD